MAKNQNNTEDTQENPEVVVDSWVISIPKPKIKKIVWGTIATFALTAVGVMSAKAIIAYRVGIDRGRRLHCGDA